MPQKYTENDSLGRWNRWTRGDGGDERDDSATRLFKKSFSLIFRVAKHAKADASFVDGGVNSGSIFNVYIYSVTASLPLAHIKVYNLINNFS